MPRVPGFFKRLFLSLAVCATLASVSSAAVPEARVHGRPSALHPDAVTSDWPTLLGPTHNAQSTESHLRKDWGMKGPPLVWEIEKGTGYSAPAVADGRVVLFHRLQDEEVVQCLNADTGKEYWRHSYPTKYEDTYQFNNGPRCTPVIDNGVVFTYGAEGMLKSFNLQTGRVAWKRHLSRDYDAPKNYFGIGTTPLIHGDLVIINVGGSKGPSVVALNRKNGRTVWQTESGSTDPIDWGASYATPVPMTVGGQPRVLVFAGGDIDPPTGGLLVLNPENGQIDFRFPFRSKRYTSVNAASPVVVGDAVFLTTSYKTGCVLVEPHSKKTKPLRWKSRALRSHFGTPIYRDGYLYGVDGSSEGNAALVCVDVRDGRQVWKESPLWEEEVADGKILPLGLGRGSLVYADGGYLYLAEQGQLLWLEMDPEAFKVRSRARLFLAKESWTPPVLSRGLLYVCQNEKGMVDSSKPRMLCYDLRAPMASSGSKP